MIRSHEQAFGIKDYEKNSIILDISYPCVELINEIMKNLKFVDLRHLEFTCTRLYSLSKDAPMWLTLHTQMVDLIVSEKLNKLPLTFFYKDLLRDALKESKPEALFTKCNFYYENMYIPRNYAKALEQIDLIKANEADKTAIHPPLKIKIDLLHAELLILGSEFDIEGDGETEDTANKLINGILDSESASDGEKAWATCLIGLLFFYSKDDLVHDGNEQTDQEIITLLQEVINNPNAQPKHKAIANLYQDLIDHKSKHAEDLSESEEDLSNNLDKVDEPENLDYYERLHENSQSPDLPEPYKAKCILIKAVEDLLDDIAEGNQEENDRLFAEFQQVIENELAFPKDIKLATGCQADMKSRGLVT